MLCLLTLTLSFVHALRLVSVRCINVLHASLRVVSVLIPVHVAGRDGPRWSQRRKRRARHDGQCLSLTTGLDLKMLTRNTQQTHTTAWYLGHVCERVLLCSSSLFWIQEDEVREYVRSEMSQHCGESFMQPALLIYFKKIKKTTCPQVELKMVNRAHESRTQLNFMKVWLKRSHSGIMILVKLTFNVASLSLCFLPVSICPILSVWRWVSRSAAAKEKEARQKAAI